MSFSVNSSADSIYFIDFAKVLNSSKPGAEAQKSIKQKLQSENKKFANLQNNIRKEESDIISQKSTLSPEEYKKKVQALRNKVADLQKNKETSFNNIAKTRSKAKNSLLKAVNPIIKKYMEGNNIQIVLDKKAVILGDTNLEITDKIISILNKELPSLKTN
jgi:Skp family chaperone for outer membrane proteins|tara:strand:+ start:733 stop:1215 length:483 start_codon:yes stop_codon:yes gene_type:complete